MIGLVQQEDKPRVPSGTLGSLPLVSIGMPVFNGENTLAVAIRSILNQTYGNWELLLMEDGSTDRTLEIALSFSDPRIRVFTDRLHKGLVPRLNQAVAMSCGKYFARLDADDVAYPERLERQISNLEQHPEIDLLGCSMLVFKDDGIAIGSRPAPAIHEEICREPSDGFHIGHPTWMGRISWFRSHPYDPKAIRTEDQVLLLRSHLDSRFACLPEILCGYRENRLVLSNILRGRYEFTKAAFKRCLELGAYSSAITTVFRQSGKALWDTVAIATGLDYVVLIHRARSLNQAARLRWDEVWSQLQHDPSLELTATGNFDF